MDKRPDKSRLYNKGNESHKTAIGHTKKRRKKIVTMEYTVKIKREEGECETNFTKHT